MRFKQPGVLRASFFLLFNFFVALAFLSCHSRQHKSSGLGLFSSGNIDEEGVASQLQNILKPIDTSHHKAALSISENVRYTYQLTQYQPIWVSSNGVKKAAKTFLEDLDSLQWDGLNTNNYHLSELKNLESQLNENKSPDINTLVSFDTLFTTSYFEAAHDLLMGEIPPKKADTLWFHPNDSTWKAPHALIDLAGNDTYTPLSNYRSKLATYGMLRDEYRRYAQLKGNTKLTSDIEAIQGITNFKTKDSNTTRLITNIITTEIPWIETSNNDSISGINQLILAYQEYKGLKPTGKIDSNTAAHLGAPIDTITQLIKANMERLRWLPQEFSDLYVLVNVPLMELFLRKDGQNVMHMRVVVGKPSRQTPCIGASMANIVINPPWGVPPTILKKDVLPGITKSGQKYLDKKGLKAYTRKGKKISTSDINASNYKRYIFKQDPGDDNALGYVKFNLPNKWDIYLHDTPHRGDFSKSYRALSSGCIRVQQPQEMAIYILSDLEGMKFDQNKLDSMIQTHKTRWEVLKNKIPVHIVYLTAMEDSTGTHVRFISDIYKRDELLMPLLK